MRLMISYEKGKNSILIKFFLVGMSNRDSNWIYYLIRDRNLIGIETKLN